MGKALNNGSQAATTTKSGSKHKIKAETNITRKNQKTAKGQNDKQIWGISTHLQLRGGKFNGTKRGLYAKEGQNWVTSLTARRNRKVQYKKEKKT